MSYNRSSTGRLSNGSTSLYSKSSNKSGIATSSFKSKVEQAILKSTEPITINETQQITANKEKGIWANKCEVCTW